MTMKILVLSVVYVGSRLFITPKLRTSMAEYIFEESLLVNVCIKASDTG